MIETQPDPDAGIGVPVPDLITELIPGYGDLPIPALEDFGGETIVLSGRATVPDALGAALALCQSWSELVDPDAAAQWITDAVATLDPAELIDFNDVVLASPTALPALAGRLSRAWGNLSREDNALLGNVALEGWTRLALGGWCTGTLALRSALVDRCTQVVEGRAQADIFLVRSLGAALDQWYEPELLAALRALAEDEDVDTDVAFELGMTRVRAAVEANDLDTALHSLGEAGEMFDAANLEGNRPDAVAFGRAVRAVQAFGIGKTISKDIALDVASAAREWLTGYLGQTMHWRQPRADTAAWWAALVGNLAEVADLDTKAWYDPPALIAAVGRLYSAYNSSWLLAGPTANTQSARSATPLGIALVIEPRLDAGLAASAGKLELVDRWLSQVGNATASQISTSEGSNEEIDGSQVLGRALTLPDDKIADTALVTTNAAVIEAVRRARERLRARRTMPGKGEASCSLLPPEVREALVDLVDEETLNIIETSLPGILKDHPELGIAPVPSNQPTDVRVDLPLPAPFSPLSEQLLLKQLCGELGQILPAEFALWRLPLTLLLAAFARSVAASINAQQSGERALPWHRVIDAGEKPAEHYLADHLAHDIYMCSGYKAEVEVPNTAGGRADVLVYVDSERFVIEVKRITTNVRDDRLAEKFGPQAQQYTLTGAPFAFLAVLDLVHRPSRLDLSSSFWVRDWKVPESGAVRALTAARILADVAPPSKLSEGRKKK